MSDANLLDEAEEFRAYPKSVQPGIPALGDVPKGWRVLPMGKLLKVVQRPVKMVDDDVYQLVTARRNRGGLVARERLTGAKIATKTQFRVKAGDFVMSRRQIAHGACGILPPELDDALVSNEYAALLPTDEMEKAFLRHLPHSIYFQQTCFHSSIGVHVEKLVFNLENWLKWDFLVPDRCEQQRIAALLDTWDVAILKSMHLAHAHKDRFSTVLARLIDPLLSAGCSIRSLFENVGSGAWGEEGSPGLRILRNADFGWDGFLSLTSAPVRRLSERDVAKTNLRHGDLVLEKSGGGPDQPVGRVCRFSGGVGYSFSNFLLRLTPKTDVDPGFCYYVLDRMYRRRDPLYFQQQTTGIRNLEWQDYLDLPINLPSLPEQKNIAESLLAAETGMHAAQRLHNQLRQQKFGLMQQLLTGKVRVPDNIEMSTAFTEQPAAA